MSRRSRSVVVAALGACLALLGGAAVAPAPAAAQDMVCVQCTGSGRGACMNCYSQRPGTCGRCRGSGTNPSDASKSCSACYGSGRCQGCNGQGTACIACNGSGKRTLGGGGGQQPAPAAPDPAAIARFVKPFESLKGACAIEGTEGQRTYRGDMRADVVADGTWFVYTYTTRYSDGAEASGAATVTYDPARGRYVLNAFLPPGRAVSFEGAPQEDGSVVFDLGQGMRMVWTLEGNVLRSRVLQGDQVIAEERVTPKRP